MKHRVLLAFLLCLAVLSGCSGKKVDLSKASESTVGVNGDGTIDELSVESFEESYYSLDELTAYVQEQVDYFNGANPQPQPETKKSDADEVLAVTVKAVEVDAEEKRARLELSYLNADLYNSFNDASLRFMTVTEAQGASELADIGELTDTKTGEMTALADLSDSDKLHVVSAAASMRLMTAGKIVYYGGDLSLIDDYTVQTGDGRAVIIVK